MCCPTLYRGLQPQAPHPVSDFLKPSAEDQSTISNATCDLATSAPCRIPVQVGLFFDGTNNNMERDPNGRRVGLIDWKSKQPALMANLSLKPEQCSHTNVVRLYQAFPRTKTAQGYFRYYIPGVGTEFKEIGELTESVDGKAFAEGGKPRIIWGILQVMNSLYRLVFKQPLYDDDVSGQLAQDYERKVGKVLVQGNGKGAERVVSHKDWFEPHLKKLKAALVARPKPAIPFLRLSVFGFSRGAAEAAAFCHFFNDLLDGGKFVGIEADICFLGLFDVVATVGNSASMSLTMNVSDVVFDGHCDWAKRILEPLPACVKAGKHFIAMHELRMNFPVTVMQGNIEEVCFPGVHSDLGGGYAPGEQGKGRGAQAALLSQIPLAHMYKAARLAGVPLVPFSELEARDKADFEIDANLASAWDAYTAALKGISDDQKKMGDDKFASTNAAQCATGFAPGDDSAFLKPHMELYYRWRAARRDSLEETTNFKAASAQNQQDLREANRMLVTGDIEALNERSRTSVVYSSRNSSSSSYYWDWQRTNWWHAHRAKLNLELDDWERWALKFFTTPKPLPPEVMRFFDDYVHDSFAGFYMAGEVTEYDKRVKVAAVKAKRPEQRNAFEKRVYEVTTKTEAAQQKKKDGKEPLNPEEEALVAEAESGGTPYPVITDKDTADTRNALIRTQTETRREGGGYVIRRGYFPLPAFSGANSFARKS